MRAAFTLPILLGWLVALSCSAGTGQADLYATGTAEPRLSTAAGGREPVAGTGSVAGGGENAQAGSPQFGSESQGSAGESIMAGQGMGGGVTGGGATAQAGSASSSGGAASVGAGAAGSFSAAGAPGSAGGGEPPVVDELASCAEACQTSRDCKIGASDYGFNCNPLTARCEKLGFPCHAALDCLPGASLWFFRCASDADCFYFSDDVCVNVAGSGRCARRAPGSSAESSGCDEPTPDGALLPRFGGGESVLVCADAGQRCVGGACVPGCRSDAECSTARNGSVCDTASGDCRCSKDDDCGGVGVSRCNTNTGNCECASDRDCEDVPGADVCVEGRCGCSSVAACAGERLFNGTRLVCE